MTQEEKIKEKNLDPFYEACALAQNYANEKHRKDPESIWVDDYESYMREWHNSELNRKLKELGNSVVESSVKRVLEESQERIKEELNRRMEGVVKKYEKVLQNFSIGRHYLDHDDATYRDGMVEAYENVLEDLKSLLNEKKEDEK